MTKIHKEIILAIFIVLFGAITWFLLHQFLYFDKGIAFLIFIVIGFLLWGISIGLGSLLINKKIISYSAFALSLLSFLIFFSEQVEAIYYFIILILTFISLIIYQKRVKHEEKARIKLHFWRIFKKGLPLIFTLICVLISLAYYFSPALGGTSKVEFKIPKSLFDSVLKPLSGLIQTRLPLYNSNMTIDELLTMFSFTSGGGEELYKIIKSKGISIETLDPDQLLKNPDIARLLQEEIKRQTKSLSSNELVRQRKEFSEKLGIEIKGNETLNDFLYELVNAQIKNLGGPYKKYIPIVLAFVMFFTLRIISILLIAFIALLSCFLIKLLIATGFAKIVTRTIEMEDIEI